jgi:hypothetical protein
VFVFPSTPKNGDPLVPVVGAREDLLQTGLNRFGSVPGLLIYNASPYSLYAENNDWGAYSHERIAAKLSGDIVFDSFFVQPVDDGSVIVEVRDTDTGEPVPDAAQPMVYTETSGEQASRDPQTGLFVLNNLAEGEWSIAAEADGYLPAVATVVVDPAQIAPVVVDLICKQAGEGEGEGEQWECWGTKASPRRHPAIPWGDVAMLAMAVGTLLFSAGTRVSKRT